ncbi:putative sulfate exporter family transporter [Halobellus sp. Atlit-31R]|nr:putative sulfate exporter family transporter [Halobellus sp. Atlit-31R]
MNPFRRVVPGLALLLAVGLVARLLTESVPAINHLIAAIVLGAVATNTVGIPPVAAPGVARHKLLLEVGIVLMGAKLAIDAVLGAGPTILLLVVLTVSFSLLLVEFLARNVFGLAEKIGSLVAAGASICGVSAVVAVASGIDADEEQIAYAVAAILLFDAVTLFLYPAIGGLLGLSDVVFGIWAGLSMFSTGPVAAAGFAYSDTAGQWATLTKLARNLLISAAVVLYSVYYARKRATQIGDTNRLSTMLLWEKFPKFIVGFAAVMLLANLGVFSEAQQASLQNAYQWLFLFAFAGLGLDMDLAKLRYAGTRPVALTFVSLAIVSTTTLVVAHVLFA